MKTLLTKFCYLALIAAGSFLFSSCNESEPKPEPEPEPEPLIPVLTFNQTECFAANVGDTLSVEYSIQNPVEGGQVEVSVSQDWITNLDTSIDGIIIFEVLPNEVEEERTAVLQVDYPSLEAPAEIQIHQDAADPAPFRFENMTPGMTSYTVDIYPENKELPYIVFASSPLYMEMNGLESDEALFEDDIEYFLYMAEYYGMSLTDFLTQLAHTGDEIGYYADEGVVPGCKYILYAYHIDLENVELIGKIVRTEFVAQTPEQFDIDVDMTFEVNGAIVNWTVAPNGYEGRYYLDAIDMAVFEEKYADWGVALEDYMLEYTNELMLKYLAMGNPLDDVMSALCRSGETTLRVTSLSPQRRYAFFVVAIDEATGFTASPAQFEIYETQEVMPSDMDVDIKLLEVSARAAKIQFTASNGEPYAANCLSKELLDSYGETDQEKIENILNAYYLVTIFDVQEYEFTTLSPDTEYVAFAFGYNGGVVTTSMFKQEFKTPSAEEAGVVLYLTDDSYYDVVAVSQLDPNFASFSIYENEVFFPITVEVIPSSNRYYYAMFANEGKEHYTESEWIAELLYVGVKTTLTRNTIMSYDVPYTFVGFACDENGQYGPLYKKEFLFTRDGVSDPQGYLDWFYGGFDAPRPSPAGDVVDAVTNAVTIRPQSVEITLPRKTRAASVAEL